MRHIVLIYHSLGRLDWLRQGLRRLRFLSAFLGYVGLRFGFGPNFGLNVHRVYEAFGRSRFRFRILEVRAYGFATCLPKPSKDAFFVATFPSWPSLSLRILAFGHAVTQTGRTNTPPRR